MLFITFCNRNRYAQTRVDRNRFLTNPTEGQIGCTAEKRFSVVTKTLRVMQLTAAIFLGLCLQVSASGLSQTVTIKGNNISLETVINTLKEQTSLLFIYTNEEVQKGKSITIDVKNIPVKEFLELIFVNQPLDFSIKGKTVFIRGKTISMVGGVNHRLSPAIETPPITVRGRIVNEKGEPVVASILVKGTNKGVTTDSYGLFALENVDDKATLIISGISIERQEIKIDGKSNIEITALTKITSEEEITISTSYWSTTKKRSTANISKVNAKDIEKQPVTNPLMSLQGRVAGLDITPYSGAPGGAVKIQIRGQNSLRNTGSYPLYIIDGVQMDSRPIQTMSFSLFANGFDPLSTIDPANIESIEVLKDADATSIYGSRGANGVIIIKTKNRITNYKRNLDINAYGGIGKIANRHNLLSTEEYLSMRHEAFRNDNVTPEDWNAYDLLRWDTSRYTDWQKTLLGDEAKISDITTTFHGGNNNTSFSFTAGYHSETTVYPGDFGFKRATVGVGINHVSINQRLKFFLTSNYGVNQNNQFNDASFVTKALTLSPNAPKLYNDRGELNWENDAFGLATWVNPFSYLKKTHNSSAKNFVANTLLSYEIIAGLTAKISLGYSDLDQDEIIKTPISSNAPSFIFSSTTGTANFSNNSRTTWIVEPQLNYIKNLGNHSITAIIGSTWQGSEYKYQGVTGTGYTSDVLLNSILAAPNKTYSEDNGEYRYQASFLRLGYNYNDKYIINGTVRRDGSSRFGPGNRFANFGSIGAAWVFTNENLMKKISSFLSFGKLRMSYGSTGNDQIGDYRFINAYRISNLNYQNRVGLYPLALYNPDFAWEVTKKFEIGIELGLIKDRISIEVSKYINRSSNQLIEYQLPLITGFPSIFSNFDATIENEGLEIAINTTNTRSRNFTWATAFNISVPNNILNKFDGIEQSPYADFYKVGEPLSIQRLYTWLGVNKETGVDEIADVNGDDQITDADRSFMKPIMRQFYGGLSNTFTFKRFELSFLIQFSKGNMSPVLSPGGIPGYLSNQPTSVLNRWKTDGQVTQTSKFSQDDTKNIEYLTTVFGSDLNTINASFARLKTASLLYNLNDNFGKKLRLQQCRIFLQAQNLFTITGFDGLDPETGNSLPPLRIITAGFQFKF